MPQQPPPAAAGLRADCGSCFGLCCVALPFAASTDFALDKPAGQPCPNLRPDFGCGIHTQLRQRGFAGCTVFDCFGAGQRVSLRTFGGRDWRREPERAGLMFGAFGAVRQLHEMLWYLTEALALEPASSLRDELRDTLDRTELLADGSPEELVGLDVTAYRAEVAPLLARVSKLVRATVPGRGRGRNRRGADLVGARLRGADLRGADLRGAYLIGADLRGADLRLADLIGADLRGARLAGANLTGALFLTQPQLTAAGGDPATRVPAALERPAHWG